MIKRFIEVVENELFRGSAPSVSDVKILHNKFGVNKIVSLDAQAAKVIDRICKLLGIEHITIPLDMRHIEPIKKLLSYNLHDLLISGGPTYVHCFEGKDRTGMVVGMFQCKYMNYSYQKALKEAESLGFGIGLPPATTEFYKKLMKASCNGRQDDNSADITDKSRDESTTSFDEAGTKSWAPFLDDTKQYPWNPTYDYGNDMYPTRNNYIKDKDNLVDKSPSIGDAIPQVGLYDNDAGVHGIGPVENGGGFVNT